MASNERRTIDDRLKPIIEELLAGAVPVQQAMQVIEDKYIDAALAIFRGNITKASLRLGIHRNTLHNKLRARQGRSS